MAGLHRPNIPPQTWQEIELHVFMTYSGSKLLEIQEADWLGTQHLAAIVRRDLAELKIPLPKTDLMRVNADNTLEFWWKTHRDSVCAPLALVVQAFLSPHLWTAYFHTIAVTFGPTETSLPLQARNSFFIHVNRPISARLASF
jgi:hypothetical protein